ncbi:MAG: alpha-L-fucosidase [Rikenellaceae bacterium]|nr:alpha-L-fucosidase [Rikenellaceae bacterium]
MKKLLVLLLVAGSLTVFAQQDPPPRASIDLPGGRAADIPPGPYTDSWESIRVNYETPQWFIDGKFGIFIHWGVYSVPAAGSEWYPRHMYGGLLKHHIENWGDPKDFGYKDFIPLFTAEKFDPAEWAALFKEAGAAYVIPTAEHHDGFALYGSELTRWNARDMGPKRDLIGDLAEAVRAEGLKFGVSNHRMEHWDFMHPTAAKEHDLYDPEYADFYGPPQKPDPTKASAMGPNAEEVLEGKEAPQDEGFLEEWLARCQEIIDKYQPDMLWFDNGINSRSLDPLKLRLAAYYYNRAEEWDKKDVSLSTKHDAYLYGTIKDYERQGRAPKEMTTYYWQVDEPIGNKFGYIEGLQLQSSESVIRKLVENISRNGNLCLNISPKADGTIPEDQQKVLREVGQWLKVNGEAVYGTRAWMVYGEGPGIEENKSECNVRFTQKGSDTFYVFMIRGKKGKNLIKSFNRINLGEIKNVSLLGYENKIGFIQTAEGLEIDMPEKEMHGIIVYKVEI